MRGARQDFTLTERLMIVAILVIFALVAMQNLLQSVEQSEQRTLKSAIGEYAAVKSMYSEGTATVPQPMIQATAAYTDAYPGSPAR
jgi:Tfp pilus assembly protein PilE